MRGGDAVDLPVIVSAAGGLLAVAVSLMLGLRKAALDTRVATTTAGDELRNDLIELFKAQNERLADQENRLDKQQKIIEELQRLIDSLRDGNRELQAQKIELERQNVELMRRLQYWESLRAKVTSETLPS